MLRKILTLMVLAVLTMAVPAQGQDFQTKKAAPKAKLMRGRTTPTEAKAALVKRLAPKDKRTLAQEAKARMGQRVAATKAGGLPAAKAVKKADAEKSPLRADEGRRVFRPFAFGQTLTPFASPRKAGEIIDDHGIIAAPAEGVRKVYTRSGMSYRNDEGLQQVEQTGELQIVECEDGTYYIRNILSAYPTNAWVKGTREGNTLTVPAKQPIFYNAQGDATYSIRWGLCEDGNMFSNYDAYAENFTFTIDDAAGTISLQNSSAEVFMGMFWDDDLAFAWHGDYETVWTYAREYEPMPVVTVTPPASGTPVTLYYKGHKLDEGNPQLIKGTVSVVVSMPSVYVKGLFADFPDAWMQGTVTGMTAEGATVVFNGLQTLGTSGSETVYAVGTDGTELQPFQMMLNVSTMSGKSQNQLLANTSQQDISAKVWISDLTVQATDPFAPIETLPYENALSSLDEWDMFSVLDANNDGCYWKYFEQQAVYSYNSEEQADDWLFTPGFRLEAGKTYHFSIDAFCSSAAFSEQMEVKMGTAMTADAMTREVIASTTIDHETAVTYENKLISISQTGTYYFGIHATSDPDMASLKVDNLLVEETVLTAPAAVSNLTVTPDAEQPVATISFTAPTTTIGGDALTGTMTADILRDGTIITTLENVTPGSSQTYTDDDPELTNAEYTYEVVCSNADGKGDKAPAVTVKLVVVKPVPYVADFSQGDTFYDFLIIDANDDGFRWEDNSPHAAYTYSSDNPADDYLVSPALKLEAGKKYVVTVNAGSAGYPEHFNVKVGREATVEGLSTTLLENCEVIMEDEKDFEVIYQPTETGAYYFAVQCVSEADQYQLWINRMSVEVAPEGGAPAAPELSVAPDAQGELEATVTIIAPTQNIDGEVLTDNIEKIELMRDGALVQTYEDVAPGATLTYTDTDFENAGSHVYQAVPYNAQGIGQKSGRQTVYVGLDVPDFVRNVTATDQQTSVLLTWDPVTSTGRNGGVVLTDDVQYVVYQCMPGTTILDGEPVAMVNDTQCEVPMNTNEGEQQYQSWVIAARNSAGESYIEDESLVSLFVGEPYALPVVESFADGKFHYYCDFQGTSLLYGQATDGDGMALALVSQQPGEVFFMSGKLNVKDAQNPTLLFDVAGFGVSSVNILGTNNGADADVLATEQLTTSYKTVKVPLNSLKDGNYAQLALVATITNPTVIDMWTGEIEEEGDALIVDNIRVVDLYSDNLGVELKAPASVQAGRTATLTATVTNWGEQAATGYTVTVKADGETLFSETVTEELQPFAKKNFMVEMATTVLDEAGDKTLTVEVTYAADQQPDNNTAEAVITLMESDAAMAENLQAEDKGDEGVSLSWSAPSATAAEYTEDFEDTDTFTPFTVGGVSATEHSGAIGEWTVYDATGLGTYSWQDNITYDNQYAPMGWMPFNITKLGFPDDFAHSGSQVMLSLCIVPDGGVTQTDHWLISPLLPGTEQPLSFYLRTITNEYGYESFEVLASQTDNQPASFTLVEQFMTDATQFEYVSTTLPEGTKYFAIRHTSNDVFGIMLDDLTFTYGSQITGYNIFVDGVLVATVEGGETTYTVPGNTITGGDHEFSVSVLYANGQESKPVSVTATSTTAINIVTAEGKAFDVFTLDGKLVRSQTRSLSGLSGVYIINNRKVVVK